MAAHSAAMSMSKIINPFWGGRLGSTVKVSQDTSLLSRRSWSLLCSSILKSVILSEHKVIWLISDSWIDKLASLFHTTTLRLSWLHSSFAEQPRHTCNLIHSQTHYKPSLFILYFRYLEQLWQVTGIRPYLLWVNQIVSVSRFDVVILPI